MRERQRRRTGRHGTSLGPLTPTRRRGTRCNRACNFIHHVYSILATCTCTCKLVVKEEKKGNPDTIHMDNTRTGLTCNLGVFNIKNTSLPSIFRNHDPQNACISAGGRVGFTTYMYTCTCTCICYMTCIHVYV